MPVVIKELVITLKAKAATDQRIEEVRPEERVMVRGKQRRELVAAAVEQALNIINAKQER